MRITVATLAFGNIPYFAAAERINREYCRLHKYSFEITRPTLQCGRALVWCKVTGVSALLPKSDYVLYLDADAYFVDHSKSIESIIKEHMEGAAMLLGTDRRDRHFAWSDTNANTGVFIVRNCAEAFRILGEWWTAPNRYDGRWLWTWPPDQGAFNYIVRQLFEEDTIHVIPYQHINGRDGTFIRHLVGMSLPERTETLESEACRLVGVGDKKV